MVEYKERLAAVDAEERERHVMETGTTGR